MALAVLPRVIIPDTNGVPRVAAKLYFYQAGTTTPIKVYTTSAYAVEHSSPVESVSSGFFPAIYVNPSVNATYKIVAKDSDGVTIWTEDNVPALGFTADDVGTTLYARTAAEIAAGVTPTYYYYQPGDVRRYGAVGDNSTNCTTAFQNAISQQQQGGAFVFIPCGTFRITSTLTAGRGLVIKGSGRYFTTVQLVGAVGFLSFTGTTGNPDGGSLVLEDFCIKGSTSSLAHVTLDDGGLTEFNRMKFWLSGANFITMDTLNFNTKFNNCLFQSFKTYGVQCTGLNSLINFESCEWSIVGGDGNTPSAGAACVYLDSGSQVSFTGVNNVNGDSTLASVVRIKSGCGRSRFSTIYAEFLTGSAIVTDSGAVLVGVYIGECDFSTTNSVAIDISAGNPAHSGVTIRNIRRPETGSVFIFSPGSGITDYDYAGVPLDGSAAHVVGASTYRAVRKYIGGRFDVDGKMIGVGGVSGTATVANNLRGSATFSAATTVSVTFGTAEADSSYYVELTPQADPVGRLWVTSKSTSGFTINNSSSTSITVDWVLIR